MRIIPSEDLDKVTNIHAMTVSELLYDIVVRTIGNSSDPDLAINSHMDISKAVDTSIDIYNTLKANGIIQVHEFDEEDLELAKELYDDIQQESSDDSNDLLGNSNYYGATVKKL